MPAQDILLTLRKIAVLGKSSDQTMPLPTTVLRDLIKYAVAAEFDSDWYLERYPDVAKAIDKGVELSALDHYANSGIYEGRIPAPIALDEFDYMLRHRDVADAVKAGEMSSASDHFYMSGFLEGRAFQLEDAQSGKKAS
ncbi:MAG: hypothetical protein AAGK30_02895 [Pseudomonadota bacterium]